MYIFIYCSLDRVEEFLDAGCDVNCIDSDRTRNTPLHWAASYSTPEILQVLIGMDAIYRFYLSAKNTLTQRQLGCFVCISTTNCY